VDRVKKVIEESIDENVTKRVLGRQLAAVDVSKLDHGDLSKLTEFAFMQITAQDKTKITGALHLLQKKKIFTFTSLHFFTFFFALLLFFDHHVGTGW